MALFDEIKQSIIDGINSADEMNRSLKGEKAAWVVPADPLAYAAGNVVKIIDGLIKAKEEEAFEAGRLAERTQIVKSIQGRK